MKNTHLMLLFTTLSILAWGVAGIFGKLAFHKKMLPFSVFLAQVIVYSATGVILVLLSTRIESISPWRSPWNIYGWLSGMAMMLGLLFFTLALHRGQATVVVPLTALYCGVSIALGYAVLGEAADAPAMAWHRLGARKRSTDSLGPPHKRRPSKVGALQALPARSRGARIERS